MSKMSRHSRQLKKNIFICFRSGKSTYFHLRNSLVFLSSQSRTVDAGRSFRTGSLAFYENKKKMLFELLCNFSSWAHIFPFCSIETKLRATNCSVGKDFQLKFRKKDQRHEGLPRCPGLGTSPGKGHPPLHAGENNPKMSR